MSSPCSEFPVCLKLITAHLSTAVCSHSLLSILDSITATLWPQANATAECFMHTLGKAIWIAHTQGIQQQLNVLLRECRSTPHSTTGTSSAVCQRKVHTKIPFATPNTIEADAAIRKRDKKDKKKTLLDIRRHAIHFITKPGDILCWQQEQNKLTTPYNEKPPTVTNVKGTMVTAEGSGYTITRNCSFFKRLNQETQDHFFGIKRKRHTLPPRYPSRHNSRPSAYFSEYV